MKLVQLLLVVVLCFMTAACDPAAAVPQLGLGAALFSEQFWYIIPIEASVVTAVTGACNSWFHVTKPAWRQAISWIVSFLVVGAAWLLHIYVMPSPQWINFIVSGIILGLVSNGFYDVPAVKAFIARIFPQS